MKKYSPTNMLLLGLFIACVALFSYLYGTITYSVTDSRLEGLHEVSCDEIEPKATGDGLWCKVSMQQEDDNIHIWRGPGSIDD